MAPINKILVKLALVLFLHSVTVESRVLPKRSVNDHVNDVHNAVNDINVTAHRSFGRLCDESPVQHPNDWTCKQFAIHEILKSRINGSRSFRLPNTSFTVEPNRHNLTRQTQTTLENMTTSLTHFLEALNKLEQLELTARCNIHDCVQDVTFLKELTSLKKLVKNALLNIENAMRLLWGKKHEAPPFAATDDQIHKSERENFRFATILLLKSETDKFARALDALMKLTE